MTSPDAEPPSSNAADRELLRGYYEREAELGVRTGLRERRIELRQQFIDELISEGRRTVVDFGAGPGLDGAGFADAGLTFIGVDLAVGNARRARKSELVVVPGSVDAPPLRPRWFDAGWSMSTLMHLRVDVASVAVRAMADCLGTGAPLWIGVWGGRERLDTDASSIVGERRPFHLRTLSANRELVSAAGVITDVEVWEAGPEWWEYHLFRVRVSEMEGGPRIV